MRITDTDFRIPALVYSGGINQIFYDIYQLVKDILDLLPTNGFIPGQIIDVNYAFKNCKKLTCSDYEKLGKIFWNDANTIWQNTELCFASCSDDFRANVPISWGGTLNPGYSNPTEDEGTGDL